MSIKLCVRALIFCVSVTVAAVAQEFSAPEPPTGTIIGTVVDVNDDPVPGAKVVLDATSLRDHTRALTNNNGFFVLDHLRPGISYHVTISASGFTDWISPEVTLKPSQYLELTGIRLGIAEAVTIVHATVSSEETQPSRSMQRSTSAFWASSLTSMWSMIVTRCR